MSEQQIESLRNSLSKFGEVEQCEQGKWILAIRIRGFVATMSNLNECLSEISSQVAGHYSKITLAKCWNNFFQIVMKP